MLISDVFGHLLVESQLLPLGLEVCLDAVTADETVDAGSDVGFVEFLAYKKMFFKFFSIIAFSCLLYYQKDSRK